MRERARFAFAQARMQARHGRRPGPGLWEKLGRTQDFGHWLQTARASGLGPALTTLASDSSTHEVDLALRLAFREHTRTVAGWHPEAWRPALRWVDLLPDLPLLRHLLDGRPVPSWLHRDRRYAALAEAEDPQAALEASPLAPLLEPGSAPLPERWRLHWRRLQQRVEAPARGTPLDRLERLLLAAWQELSPPLAPEAPATPARRERVETELQRLFRRQAQGPAASFAYLGLVWLDLQRARGALVRRRALPEA